MNHVKPFTIEIAGNVLDDLHSRLAQTRWPRTAETDSWDYGTSLNYMKELVTYWRTKYDWRKCERQLNAFPQFKTEIRDVNIHFVYVKGKGLNAKPLILTHGWPDSFYRFYEIIPLLTEPSGNDAGDSFDLIIPSIPGFGFSDHISMSTIEVADLWAELMTDQLGYSSFYAAGGDVGSGVTIALAQRHPQHVRAIHLTDAGYPTGMEDPTSFTANEKQFQEYVQGWFFSQGAYAMVQSTKPQSLAYGLHDSPAALAAWIISMIDSGAEDHQVEKAFGNRDALLTNIMIYWVSETAASSATMYLKDAHALYSGQSQQTGKTQVPAGIALFPREAQFPQEWAERKVNVQAFTKMKSGGHFAAMEEPQLFANEIRSFFRDVNTSVHDLVEQGSVQINQTSKEVQISP